MDNNDNKNIFEKIKDAIQIKIIEKIIRSFGK
jgi:hypothetical protein